MYEFDKASPFFKLSSEIVSMYHLSSYTVVINFSPFQSAVNDSTAMVQEGAKFLSKLVRFIEICVELSGLNNEIQIYCCS